MRIRLIDVDGHNFPNLPLMKISAYHKSLGDEVEWYDPLLDWITVPDIVYMSKVFSYTSDYEHPINGKKIIKGRTSAERNRGFFSRLFYLSTICRHCLWFSHPWLS